MIDYISRLLLLWCTACSCIGIAQNDKEVDSIQLAFSYINTAENHKTPAIIYELLRHNKNRETRLKGLIILGQHYNNINEIDSSLYYANKAINELEKGKKDAVYYGRLARVYNILAVANEQRGLIEENISWRIRGIEVSEKGKDTLLLNMHKHGLAYAYSKQDRHEEALEIFTSFLDAKDAPRLIFATHINIGVIQAEQGAIAMSNTSYMKALPICEELGDNRCKIVININLGDNYRDQGNLDKALAHYRTALKMADAHKFKKYGAEASVSISKILIASNMLNEAAFILVKALDNAVEGGFLELQAAIYRNLITIYSRKKKYRTAFAMQQKKERITDSINAMQRQKEIYELEVKYRTLQGKKEIAILKKDKELRKTELFMERKVKIIAIISFVVILIPIICLLVVYYQKLKTQYALSEKKEEVHDQKISSLVKDQELKLIKALVKGQNIERKKIAQNLHDSLGGTLASIKLQINNLEVKDNRLPSILEQLDDAYEEVRNFSHDLIPQKFQRDNFIQLIKEYVNNIGDASKLDVNVYTYPEEDINKLDSKFQNEIFMILQELITNTIKHAKATRMDIEFNLLPNAVSLLFEDNGKGFLFDKQKTGIGLSNIQSRLKALSGSFHIDSMPKRGTIVNIELPV
ncbi:tetratricopeptide repeat protein [Aquimarina sp. TRL1]|uniref:tetratricopeptide repeat-containing sensor histidine kinase n=1 Tax=Aquimarina sp. (strain TRL1) TaxID=2736252 RepID=UPI00158F5710|nr:tetratricopeptide repeat-containing sensor histidine kinase [Aquimarina sp. TRL1]QKX05551.1 tetratricopeptide repeat protein [Aquimarina sp. TRL1]